MNGWNISSYFHLRPSSIYDPKTVIFVQKLAQNWRTHKKTTTQVSRKCLTCFAPQPGLEPGTP